MAQSGEESDSNTKPRYIITARALEEEEAAVSTSEPGQDESDQEVSTEYDQVTDETERAFSEEADNNQTSTESGIFTSPAGSTYTAELNPTAASTRTSPLVQQELPSVTSCSAKHCPWTQ